MEFLPKHKKRVLSTLLCGSMLFACGAPVIALERSVEEMPVEKALESSNVLSEEVFSALSLKEEFASRMYDAPYALKRMGIINGDDKGDLMLTKTCTRQEAFTVFLSLLGERKLALESNYSHPFRDVSAWFDSSAGYGYYKGYTLGISQTAYGAQDFVTQEQFMTFVLRAMGYVDGVDFTWNRSLDKAVELEICTQEQAAHWKQNTFRRQEVFEMAYMALNGKMKGSACTLADSLIAKGFITKEQAEMEGLSYGDDYTDLLNVVNATALPAHVSLPEGNFELHNAGGDQILTAPATVQATVTLEKDVNAPTQMFTISGEADGTFRLLCSVDASFAVDSHARAGVNSMIWRTNDTECQRYLAIDEGHFMYSIRAVDNPSFALTAVNGVLQMAPYTGQSEQQWTLSSNMDCEAEVSRRLQEIMAIHPNGQSLGSGYHYAGASQCMAFGREVFDRLFGGTARWSYDGSPKSYSDGALYDVTARSYSFSASSMRALLSNAKAGDILQMNTPKMHTMVFVSKDEGGFTVYDANWTGSNKVSVRYVKYGDWAGRNSSSICVLHSTQYPI